jgi:hypothetical protein
LIKRETEDIAGQVGLFAGLLTFGIGSVVAVVNTNIKMRSLKREFRVDSECFKTSIFRLYSIGYRIAETFGSDAFRLECSGERYHGRIF